MSISIKSKRILISAILHSALFFLFASMVYTALLSMMDMSVGMYMDSDTISLKDNEGAYLYRSIFKS